MLSRTDSARGQRIQRALPIAAPALLTLCVCGFGIGASQLWQDEHATWWATQLSSADFARLLHNVDIVHAPYYLLMRAVTWLLGDTEAALRAPSALAMSGCAALVGALGSQLYGASVGLRAGLLFALLPLVSRFGQEARPYALAALFAALATWLLHRYLERPFSKRLALAYGAALLALGLSHLLALLLLLSHATLCVRLSRARPYVLVDRARVLRMLPVMSVVCLLLLPLVLAGRAQSAQINDIPLPDLSTQNFSRALGTGQLAVQLLLAAFLVYALCAPRANMLLRTWAVLPLLFLAATHSTLHLFRLRYLVFTLPAWLLLSALSLERPQSSRRINALITAFAALLMVTATWKMHTKFRSALGHASADYRALAQHLSQHARAGDALAFGGVRGGLRRARLAMAYQLRGVQGTSLPDIFEAESMAERGLFAATECVDPAACLPSGTSRIWLVTNSTPSALYEGIPQARAQLLQTRFFVADTIALPTGTLALFSLREQQKTTASAAPAL